MEGIKASEAPESHPLPGPQAPLSREQQWGRGSPLLCVQHQQRCFLGPSSPSCCKQEPWNSWNGSFIFGPLSPPTPTVYVTWFITQPHERLHWLGESAAALVGMGEWELLRLCHQREKTIVELVAELILFCFLLTGWVLWEPLKGGVYILCFSSLGFFCLFVSNGGLFGFFGSRKNVSFKK